MGWPLSRMPWWRGRRPVRIEPWAGSVSGAGDWAARNRNAAPARRSISGVAPLRLTQPRASGRSVSTVIRRTLGRAPAGDARAASTSSAAGVTLQFNHVGARRAMDRGLLRATALGVLLPGAMAAASAHAAPRASVVLVTLDTTRADALGCYGAPRKTPNLDALGLRGVRYARALTASPLTLPAHSSLLTGLEPPEHGVTDNGTAVLEGDVPTLASVLSARGYATAAFVGSRILDRR